MPVVTSPIDSYKVPENARDVSSTFYEIAMPDTPLFNRMPMSKVCTATKKEWWDDIRMPIGSTVGTAHVADSGVLVLASTAGIRVGAVLRCGEVVYRVTTVTNATTLAVALISAADAAATVGTKVDFLGTAKVEGAQFEESDYTQKVQRFNVTQIFDDYMSFTGTELAVNREVQLGSLLQIETMKKLRRMYLGLARTVLNGVRVTAADNTTPRLMGGIDWFIKTYGYNPAAVAFSADNLDAFLLECSLTYGITPTELFLNPTDLKAFTSLRSSQIVVDRLDSGRGEYVDSFVSSYGFKVKLTTDPQLTPKKLRLFDLERQVNLQPLAGRQFNVYPVAKVGDTTRVGIVGEYTLEFNDAASSAVMSLT